MPSVGLAAISRKERIMDLCKICAKINGGIHHETIRFPLCSLCWSQKAFSCDYAKGKNLLENNVLFILPLESKRGL